MTLKLFIVRLALGAAPLIGSASAISAPPEPLIVTKLPDPDPNYIPQGAGQGKKTSIEVAGENPVFDQAMEDFGRAIGQATLLEQQMIEARCKSERFSESNSADRFAWAANCRYQRH